MTRAHHPQNLGILPREVLDRNSRRRRGPERSQQVATNHRLRFPGIRVEKEHRRLVVDQPALCEVVWPIPSGLEAKREARTIKPPFEPIKSLFMPNSFAHDRKVIRIAGRHGGKNLLNGIKGRLPRHQIRDVTLGNNPHVFLQSKLMRPRAAIL